VFVRFEEARVYEMKTLPLARISGFWPTPTLGVTLEEEEFVSEGSNGAPIPDMGDQGDSDSPTVIASTAQETSVMPTRMCKLEGGRKFPYVITDIHEAYRRHVKIDVNSFFTKQTMNIGTTDYDVYTIPVAPYLSLTRVFKAWSGHLKFRFFNSLNASVSLLSNMLVDYVPTGTYQASKQNYAFLMGDRGKVTSTWSSTVITGAQRMSTMAPSEMAYPVASNVNMIDISVPFNSHLNFLPTAFDAETFGTGVAIGSNNFLNGYLIVRVAQGSSLEVFQALGDDFRYQVFLPPDSCYVGAYTGSTAPTGADFAGNIY